jgi:hypothetical protein
MRQMSDAEEREDFAIIIRAMDAVYVADTNRRMNEERPKS